MPKFAVAYSSMFENDIQMEVVDAPTVKDAVIRHTVFNSPESADHFAHWFEDLPDDLAGIKQFFFDGDILVGAIEL